MSAKLTAAQMSNRIDLFSAAQRVREAGEEYVKAEYHGGRARKSKSAAKLNEACLAWQNAFVASRAALAKESK